jgi:DNA-binding transcriptional MerR regulator
MSAKSAFLSEKSSNAEGKRWIGLHLQQADFSIEEIKSLLGRNDDYVLAAFERKVEEQEQKLAKIRKIQKSYLEETMEMCNKGAPDGIDEGMIMI